MNTCLLTEILYCYRWRSLWLLAYIFLTKRQRAWVEHSLLGKWLNHPTYVFSSDFFLFAITVYIVLFLHYDRFGALVAGWVSGSVLVPNIPSMLLRPTWTLELLTSLVVYLFLFVACTFLKWISINSFNVLLGDEFIGDQAELLFSELNCLLSYSLWKRKLSELGMVSVIIAMPKYPLVTAKFFHHALHLKICCRTHIFLLTLT